jgi:hypothetical protein
MLTNPDKNFIEHLFLGAVHYLKVRFITHNVSGTRPKLLLYISITLIDSSNNRYIM